MLPNFAVDKAADTERVRVADFVGRHDPWAIRAVRVERLADDKLRGLHLPVANADVVGRAVAKYDFLRAFHRHMAATLADDKSQFRLVVKLGRDARKLYRTERRIDRSAGFGKPDLLGRCAHSRLGNVIGIIQADAENFPWPRHRRQQRDVCQCNIAAFRSSQRFESGLKCRPLIDQTDHVARCVGKMT